MTRKVVGSLSQARRRTLNVASGATKFVRQQTRKIFVFKNSEIVKVLCQFLIWFVITTNAETVD